MSGGHGSPGPPTEPEGRRALARILDRAVPAAGLALFASLFIGFLAVAPDPPPGAPPRDPWTTRLWLLASLVAPPAITLGALAGSVARRDRTRFLAVSVGLYLAGALGLYLAFAGAALLVRVLAGHPS